MLGFANNPTHKPPIKPATPCVCSTPNVSSTFLRIDHRPTRLRLNHTTTEANSPVKMEPKPSTYPAAGVMDTSTPIIPLSTDPADGLPNANISSTSQTSSATAVAMFVLSTAAAASALAKYGSPPLKPFQPSHSSPAPAKAMIRLLGSK